MTPSLKGCENSRVMPSVARFSPHSSLSSHLGAPAPELSRDTANALAITPGHDQWIVCLGLGLLAVAYKARRVQHLTRSI